MCTEPTGVQPNASDPLGDEPCILSCRDTPSRIASTGEQKFGGLPAGSSKVIIDCLPGLLRQFELDGLPGLLLSYRRSIDCVPVRCNVLDLEGNNIAATQFAVDRQIKHCQIAGPSLDLELCSD